ncbi:MAG: TetR/AcrR family transcriptional regulator [Desulfosudaceae bacterium]
MPESTTRKSKAALRREREKEQRYNTILRMAESLFVQQGYHQTSLEAIADAAEVSVGTVYFYFKNKEDLLISLMKEVGYHLRKVLGDAFLGKHGTMEGIVEAGMSFFQNFCRQHPDKLSIFFRESGGQGARLEATRKELYGKLIDDLKNALVRVRSETGVGYRSEISAELMAVCILGIYERVAGYYLLWHDRPEEMETVARDVTAFTVGGINNLMV